MESLFPNLFTFSYFAPLILRIAIAIVLFEAARGTWKQQKKGKVASFTSAILGTALVFGAFTQLTAILGIIEIGILTAQRGVPSIFHRRSFALLVIAILTSLLLTGPGALAIDLPY
ncbi:MAG: hypothetical protein WC880_03695 [Candidatus Paceibacterota bacterium]